MCGIVTIFNYNTSQAADREELRRICDYMTARGPDGYGEWYSGDSRVGLGHRRLAIIDLSENGAQPMSNQDGSLVISFNGEIYNYLDLRGHLESKGHHFRSSSDTEVLLHLYEEKGDDFLKELRGMFAFVLWDARKKNLLMVRDPFGIKPLYYADDGRTVRAASQVKALLKGNNIDTSPEPAGHVGFFLWGHVPDPYTLYAGIQALPAGSMLKANENGLQSLTFYSDITKIFADAEAMEMGTDSVRMRQCLRSALLDTVRHHLISDVPVGVFLSSGLDSTTLLALASEISSGERMHAVTLGFKEYRNSVNDETILAERVAKYYGAAHKTIWVSKEDFRNDFPHFVSSMDQPTIDGVNNYCISKAAVKAGLKVALSGLGGDEMFGSYPSFREIPMTVRVLSPFKSIPSLGRMFRRISAPVLKLFTSPKYAGLLEYGSKYGGAYLLRRGMFMPWELPEVLDGEIVRLGWQRLQPLQSIEKTIDGISGPHPRISALELMWYMRNQLLRDTDWAGMAHSLEIRTPLVDIQFFRNIVPFLAGGSPPCKKDMAGAPSRALPAEILNRKKTGFSVPVREWILKDDSTADSERGLRGWAKRVYGEMWSPS